MLRKAGFALLIVALVGCESMPTQTVFSDTISGSVTERSIPEDLQSTFYKLDSSSVQFCLEPFPDAGVSLSEGVQLGAAAGTLGGNEQALTSSLGGRGELTLVTRELMYRACELSLNINASPEQTLEIYERFLDALVRLSLKDAAEAEREKDDDD